MKNLKHSTKIGSESFNPEEEKRKELLKRFGLDSKYIQPPTGKPIKSQNSGGDVDSDVDAWNKSGYVDYMENQREKGWKT